MIEMPISAYPKWAQKMYRSMTKQHGAKKGRKIFYKTVNARDLRSKLPKSKKKKGGKKK